MTIETIRANINCLIGDQTRCFEDIVIDLRAIAEHASSFADAFEDEEFPEIDTLENAA